MRAGASTRAGPPDRAAGLRNVMESLAGAGAPLESFDAVGHRVVHGGPRFTAAGADRRRRACRDPRGARARAAPQRCGTRNHRRRQAAAPGRSARGRLRHRVPRHAAARGSIATPSPPRGSASWGVRRYGFHGLSLMWSVREAAELLQRPAKRCASSLPTSAAAARSRPWMAAARSTHRWA